MNDPLTFDELRLALSFIPADDRETWVNIGNAVKTEYGDEGFQPWDDWSQQSDAYKASDAKSVWRSLTPGHVTLGTIIKLAQQGGWRREKRELSMADRRRLKQEQAERRRARQAQIEADEKQRVAMNDVVATACRRFIKQHCRQEGRSPYLDRKQVNAYGVWFSRVAAVISTDDQRQNADIWAGTEVKQFFDDLPDPRPDHLSFLRIQVGDVIVPLRDLSGAVQSMQVIKGNGTKLFPRYGRKAGLWHRIGDTDGAQVIAVAEGYATAASVHMATGWPVAVAIDSGNLVRVVTQLRLVHPDARLVVCGDDDPSTPGNPGRTKAEEAAQVPNAVAVFPEFEVAS
ncbi:hypothetical protein R84981_000963 [Carnimonas sp. R-84981]|uniref:PriCT-2 domain-containing protein n=1 Tax=Carnimonas bestiolae TaxID=3402172 RepID=UPI003EDC9F24